MPPLPRSGAAGLFWRTVVARGYPRYRGSHRQKSWIFMEVAMPLLGTIAMVYVYRGLHAPDRYLGFAILGGAMLAFWQNVIWSMASQFYWDRSEGNLELYAVSPTGFVPILLGMALGAIPPTLLRAAIVVVVGSLLFGVSYAGANLLGGALVFLLTLAGLYCLGMLLASLFLFYGREAWHLSSGMQEPVYLFSGLYFPVRALGGFAGAAVSLLPLAVGLDAMRQLLLPGSPAFISVTPECLILAAQTVVFATAARFALATVERRAREEGRLITRWA